MEDDARKYLYLKFHIKDDIGVMDSFLISEDKDRVQEWKANHPRPEDASTTTSEPPIKNAFQTLQKKFDDSIKQYDNAAPVFMRMSGLLLRIMNDRSIREFIKRHGDALKTGEYETYRISIDSFGEINKRLQEAAAIASGFASLPSLFFVGLVSAYDEFISDLIKLIFAVCPELLSSSEKNISFRDLVEIGSVEDARNRIIEKEVETVMRQNHADQIKWLSTKLRMPLTNDLKIWPDFIELCERRNLLTHTGGIVSTQYVTVCKEHGVPLENVSVGQKLDITRKYYADAVQTILEFGTKLTQVVWRKLVPTDLNTADRELNEFAYSLIVRRRYTAAATMLRFGLYEMKKHGLDLVRKMMVVNYANAEKLAGNGSKAGEILDAEDWSASTEDYRICVAAVKDDVEGVIRMMKHVVESGGMKIASFRDWPVFESVRTDPRFVEAFEREFGQKLIMDKETRSLEAGKIDIDEGESEMALDAAEPQNKSTIH